MTDDEFSERYRTCLSALDCGHSFVETKRGFYVYFLCDPIDGSIFYVGKGKGARVLMHEKSVRRGNVDNAAKFEKIQDIHSQGLSVLSLIYADNLSEPDAYTIERNLIKSVPYLTNSQQGIYSAREKAATRAKYLLANIRPFFEWVDLPPTNLTVAMLKVWGSYTAFYDWYVGELEKDAAGLGDVGGWISCGPAKLKTS
jgi:hypothetical protein